MDGWKYLLRNSIRLIIQARYLYQAFTPYDVLWVLFGYKVNTAIYKAT